MHVSIAIMAAGFGTRMKSKKPKVLHAISGFSMLYHIIKEAKKISDDIHVVLHHQSDLIKEHISNYFQDITYVLQDYENFPGTGGAIKNVKPKYKKILILNGDMPLIEANDMKYFLKEDSKVVMSSFTCINPMGYGRVVMDISRKVLKIVEHKDASKNELLINSVNAGVYLFDTEFLNQNLPKLSNSNTQKEYYITDLISMAHEQNIEVKAIQISEESFMGVNSKYHLSMAEEIMQKRIKKRFMENGVIMSLPSTIYIESDVKIEGETVLQSGVSLLRGSKIINSIIKTNSIVENSTLKNSEIGPMARIRPESILIDSKIGNFVEIKKSTLQGVKAGHLSYLGDSQIDSGTNIGCGTITCNYNGKEKHKTIIGKNVFVGSDSQLIAPIVIEDDVIIASGTTVTQNIKKGSLVLARAKLKIIDNFFYKFFGKNNA
ncbi:MAG: bifunctional UDP-N-acetylglucosamine diphosphorylase/glucosamine-1-phosphate N-acetyltransferase GlmU [Sulfurospirillum sp.]|nr:bifunctional UDP-N-acetylglucosamine diphosphorylase/glucosamine-1-phosphate N-acetyltransferase GlmU [Sulfurospirillum sp.]MBL0703361.1 bifunctional UDP-N-acetylglucosamine diphosphorylase/glucosamine-1-phosphate N-acetyltransferase GlmU [Sulfurospirillum sp.]